MRNELIAMEGIADDDEKDTHEMNSFHSLLSAL
jgi:hypothetical protein